MNKLLTLLLLAAPAALAQTPAREPFPSDYTPAPCAAAATICHTFQQSKMSEVAALKGYDLPQAWINAHWDEMHAALGPVCAKLATCFATPGNDWLFCNDALKQEAQSVCDKYPEGSDDRTSCRFFVRVWYFGHDRQSSAAWRKMQACAAEQTPPSGERTFEVWMNPAKIGPGYKGRFTVYAVDTETHIPVQARVLIDTKDRLKADDVPDGRPTVFYPVKWPEPKLNRVPNANGHFDLAPPQVRVEAPGYRTVTFTLPMEVPQMTVEMSPKKLKRGKNVVTITARDAVTGEPVEARVMGGTNTLGRTNEPFELVIKDKCPEIWVTSLFDRYGDVVVAP